MSGELDGALRHLRSIEWHSAADQIVSLIDGRAMLVSERDEAVELLTDLANESAVEREAEPGVPWVTVQIDPDTWAQLQAWKEAQR